MYELKICHLYPEMLHGDGGNITVLTKRLQWRGIEADVTKVSAGEKLSAQDYDLFFFGGGEDFERELILKDLAAGNGEEIKKAVDMGKVFLAVCGGYQLLGESYTTAQGVRQDCIGAIPVITEAEKQRITGNCMFALTEGDGAVITGFENHGGRTRLGEGAIPLGTVLSGGGNNGVDGTEGARYKNVFCSYAHGVLLAKNPVLADVILKTALENKYGKMDLAPLEDGFENNASAYMKNRLESEK